MYGRTTVRPIVDTRKDNRGMHRFKDVDEFRGRRIPIRPIGRTVVRPYIASSEF
jgi:hypothetical protein